MTPQPQNPVAIDEVHENGDHFVTEWYCDPPAVGQKHRVLRDEWDDHFGVRRIHEWEPSIEPPEPEIPIETLYIGGRRRCAL